MNQEYAEKVLERAANGYPLRTELVPLDQAGDDCKNPCGHKGVKMERGWLYDYVSCLVCGEGLGVA